jgi:N-acetylglutamate synthase-like GNAT family acetyltransferase
VGDPPGHGVRGVATRLLDHAPAGWAALLEQDPNASPAQRAEVVETFAEVVPGHAARFIVVEEAGALIGGAALTIERRAGLAWIHAMPHLLPGAPLAADPKRRAAVDPAVAAAIGGLQRELGAVGGEWVLYRPEGPELSDAATPVSGETLWSATAVVELAAGIEAAREHMGRRMRQYVRNESRGLTFAEEPEALETVHALHQRMARQWTAHRPLPLELSRRLLERGAARLYTLRSERRLLCGCLFLDHPRERFAWWSGIHHEARGRHVFHLLLWLSVERAAEEGVRRVNLGGSAGRASLTSFKEALGAREVRVPVRWLDAAHGSWTARAVAGLQAWRRRGRPRGERA